MCFTSFLSKPVWFKDHNHSFPITLTPIPTPTPPANRQHLHHYHHHNITHLSIVNANNQFSQTENNKCGKQSVVYWLERAGMLNQQQEQGDGVETGIDDLFVTFDMLGWGGIKFSLLIEEYIFLVTFGYKNWMLNGVAKFFVFNLFVLKSSAVFKSYNARRMERHH